jgi:type IV pilus assembly protein PilY1
MTIGGRFVNISATRSFFAAALWLLLATCAFAEDIDIFTAGAASSTNPQVLMILDNASAWDASASFACPDSNVVGSNNAGKDVGFEQCALYEAIKAIGNSPALIGKLDVGLMMFGSSNNWGGIMKYPSSPPYRLPTMDTTGISAFQTYIKSIDRQADNSNGSQVGGGMYEAYSFFAGKTSTASGVNYASHIGSACQRNFIIYIANALNNGKPQDTGANAQSALSGAGASSAQMQQINTSYIGTYTKYDANWGDEWARFLYQTDLDSHLDDQQNIITYTIAVTDGKNPDYIQFTKSMANAGGGKNFVVTVGDVNGLVEALLKIFYEVQAVNSVFASTSLPVASNAQGSYQNQVFIGMFRPDANGGPRWMGNLKQYQFGVSGTAPNVQLFLADSTGADAISSSGTGFISPTAVSFWTKKDPSHVPDSIGGFWLNDPQGAGGGYDKADGEVVEKGGVSQQIRLANLTVNYDATPTGPRKLYTCFGTSGLCASGAKLSDTPFATTNTALTAAALGITNATYSLAVSSISRASATGAVTVTLASAPTPAIADPTLVTISGSTNGQYDYSLAGKSPTASGATITYSLPAEYPPMPPNGSYTATGAAAGVSNVTSLSRNSEPGWFTGTASLSDITFNGGSNVAIGDSIVISNSVGGYYDGTVSVVSVTGSNVTFRAAETPYARGGAGTIANTNGSDTVGPSTSEPPGVVRGTSCSGCTTNSGKVLMVTIVGGTKKLNPNSGPLANGTTVNLSGVTPSNYNLNGLTVIGTGSACTVTYKDSTGAYKTYSGTANTGSGKNTIITTICLDLGASFAIYPSVSGYGAQSSPQTKATRQNSSVTRTISGYTVTTASNCPTSSNETVQATTTTAHGFSNGEVVTVGAVVGAPVPANEAALVGSKTITVTGANTFTYTVATTPTCVDNKSGLQIAYQSSAGGISTADLVHWIRGDDNVGDEQSPGNGINVRPSVHGDVVHSRPTIINYGGSTGVVVFYGANDGVFRAVNGNQSGSIGGVPPGGELWGFVPQEFLPRLARLYSNSPLLKLANTPSGLAPTPQPKDYFFDGVTGVYQDPASGSAYIYLSARRGGRILYALDVTDPTTPRFMWKRGCPSLANNAGCDAGFNELGQTWSQPKLALVKGYANPVVIFGGGYAGGYDTSGTTPTYAPLFQDAEPPNTDTMGRGIFVLDAINGSIVWRVTGGGSSNTCQGNPCQLLDMTYAIPADITLLDRISPDGTPPDGYIDRLYAADAGGNIWRVDLEPGGKTAPGFWQVTKLAALGGSGATKRKFLFPVDIITTKQYDAVLAGTGDREHPLYGNSSYGIVNRFYMIKDLNIGNDGSSGTTVVDNTSSTTDDAPNSLFHVVVQFNADGTSKTVTPYPSSSPLNGFYISLTNTGEKVVNAPTTIGGFTYFGTNQPVAPSALSCKTGLGNARAYQVNFITGATTSEMLDGGGLPPSPVQGLVAVKDNQGNQIFQPFLVGGNPSTTCTGPDCRSALGGTKPVIPISPTRRRLYWYLNNYDK